MCRVLTIGHSSRPEDEFLAQLAKHNVDMLVDVRSKPRSRFYPHFNRKSLEDRLAAVEVAYLYLGTYLGGHPDDDSFYENDRVVYERLVEPPEFNRDLTRVVELCKHHNLVLMCAEEDPVTCHRHPLLALELIERGVQVLHLRRDGLVQDADELFEDTVRQMPFMEPPGEDLSWSSPKKIRRRGRP